MERENAYSYHNFYSFLMIGLAAGGLSQEKYVVSESEGGVNLCVTAFVHKNNIFDPVTVSVTSVDKSASGKCHYQEVQQALQKSEVI